MHKVTDVFQLSCAIGAQDRPLAANLIERAIASTSSQTADRAAMFYTPRATLAALSQHLGS